MRLWSALVVWQRFAIELPSISPVGYKTMTERDGTPHFLWSSSHPIDYRYCIFSCPLGFGAWEFSTCAEALAPLPPRTLEGWKTIKKEQHRVVVCGNPCRDSPVYNAKQSGNGWNIEMRGKNLAPRRGIFYRGRRAVGCPGPGRMGSSCPRFIGSSADVGSEIARRMVSGHYPRQVFSFPGSVGGGCLQLR